MEAERRFVWRLKEGSCSASKARFYAARLLYRWLFVGGCVKLDVYADSFFGMVTKTTSAHPLVYAIYCS